MRLSATVSVSLLAVFLVGLSAVPDAVTFNRTGRVPSASDLPGVRATAPLVINEILFAPADTDAEFIEILNRTDRAVPLHAFSYADANEDFDPVLPSTLPDSVRQHAALAPGGYLVLVRDSAAFAQAFPKVPAPITSDADRITAPAHVIVLVPDDWEGLNNGGDTVYLRNGESVVEQVEYDSDWADDDASTERIDPNGPARAFNFASSVRANNDRVDLENTATPGARNSVYHVDTTPPDLIAAEERPASENGDTVLRLVFSEGLDASTVTPDAFRVGSAPGSPIASVYLHDNLQVVDLTLASGHDPLAPGESATGGNDAPPHGTSPLVQARGLADRMGNLLVSDEHPLALQPPGGSVPITEIMFDPRSDQHDGWADQTEYVEVENTGPMRVTLRGAALTGVPDEHGEADVLARAETGDVLDPGERAVFFAERGLPGGASSSLAALQRAFPEIDTTAGAWIAIPSSSLRLTNSGRSLVLRSAETRRLDSLAYDPDWHVSDLMSTDGVSLERVSIGAPSHLASNWTSTAHPDGGTPGAANSVSLPADAPPRQGPNEANVQVSPSPFSIERDVVTRIQYALDGPRSLRIEIYDAHGRPVRTLASAWRTAARGELLWDGLDDDGRRVPVGIYVIWFEAVDADGGRVDVAKKTVVLARPL
jgi:hypothetical protein